MNKKSTLRSVANDYLTHPKKEKGITLIVLVVTIVVLIILDSISIFAVFGDSGIVKKAQEAREKTEGWNEEWCKSDDTTKVYWNQTL